MSTPHLFLFLFFISVRNIKIVSHIKVPFASHKALVFCFALLLGDWLFWGFVLLLVGFDLGVGGCLGEVGRW